MDNILELSGITKSFEGVEAVNIDSFVMKRGECLGIAGESGSGKSTLARIIMRFVKADTGKIIFNGEDISNYNSSKMRNVYEDVQMIFQYPRDSFDSKKKLGSSIIENNKSWFMSKEDKLKAQRLLEEVGLEVSYVNKYPHQISGGECQRAAIARALNKNPKLLICDEATSALDVTIQQQIVELIKELQKKRGLSVLFISHDMALLSQICDRMAVIHNGKIIECDSVEKIITTPQNEYTKQLIESVL